MADQAAAEMAKMKVSGGSGRSRKGPEVIYGEPTGTPEEIAAAEAAASTQGSKVAALKAAKKAGDASATDEAIQAEVAALPGAEVVAGDTDSVMFKLAGCTLTEAEAKGKALAASVTTKLRADGAHLGVGGVADRPVAQTLPLGDDLPDALNTLAWSLGAQDDVHASAAYRRQLVRELGQRLIEEPSHARPR